MNEYEYEYEYVNMNLNLNERICLKAARN